MAFVGAAVDCVNGRRHIAAADDDGDDAGYRTWNCERRCRPLSIISAHFHGVRAPAVRSLAIAHAAAAASIAFAMLASLF